MIQKDNWIYLHIPRTAGSYIESLFRKHYDLVYEVDHHSTVYDIENQKNKFIFGFVRNPYSYEWSLWRYSRRSWEVPFTFDEWCAYRFDGKSDEGYDKYPHLYTTYREATFMYVRVQAGYFCDENKKCVASQIYRFEELKESWNQILQKINVNIPININDTIYQSLDYQKDYTDYSYDLVTQYKAKDLEIFGYDFDGYTGDVPLDYSVDYVGTNYAYTH
tara:strand:- start:68 stop:724 length:657 start_codon:yes stop_codon:yes gene_type:complete